MYRFAVAALATLGFVACNAPPGLPDVEPIAGTALRFELFAHDTRQSFFDFPYPSDLRLAAGGGPDLQAFPNPRNNPLVSSLTSSAEDRVAFPLNAVGYFRFDGALSPRSLDDVIAGAADAPVLLVGVDPSQPDFGTLYPVVAGTLQRDVYVPSDLLAVAPRPGVLLRPDAQYAYVVLRSANDASGAPLGVPRAIERLKRDLAPLSPKAATEQQTQRADAALSLYRRLWPALELAGVARADVAAASVFSTGDVVADLFEISESLRARHDSVAIGDLTLDADDGDHPRYCELLGKITLPQFQQGTPPFNTGGSFELGADGVPIKTRDVEVPLVISIPKAPMPEGGYPLMVYVHGSGGLSAQLVDRGPAPPNGPKKKGEGPAHVIAPFGIAGASMGMPVSPERLPGAGDYDYLNFKNISMFRDTFRQGVIDLRLLVDALERLEIDPATLGSCSGPTLPAGAKVFSFRNKRIAVMGQSMGGMYANMFSAVEPRAGAVVPTGAGGYWSYFLFFSSVFPSEALPALVGTLSDDLSFAHPIGTLLATAWEAADPLIYTPRLSRRRLAGHPARHVYEPVGRGDSFFSPPVYDAMVLGYGHQQAGKQVWPTMQKALALAGLDGIVSYPVRDNLAVEGTGTPKYTGVVVQYEGDGFSDPHSIAFQLDDVKYQYGCFLSTFFKSGVGEVFAPKALGAPCQ